MARRRGTPLAPLFVRSLRSRRIEVRQGTRTTLAHPNQWGNTLQGRYIIRHRWDGAVDCEAPVYSQWWGSNPDTGAPPGGPLTAVGPIATGPGPRRRRPRRLLALIGLGLWRRRRLQRLTPHVLTI